jgi:LruC domain-containing protein/uncharacterized repeat protein (TIGR01451 family)
MTPSLRLTLLIAILVAGWLPSTPPASARPLAPISAPGSALAPQIAPPARRLLLAGSGPALALAQSVSQEPLIGGVISYSVIVSNTSATPVTDRGYNLTISDTLPVGLTYSSATPAPTLVSRQANGTTLLAWDNIADLEAGEALTLQVTAALGTSLTTASTFVNMVTAKANTAPDNSGTWVTQSGQIAARPQAIDIDMVALPSTAAEQATGAGEYAVVAPGARAGADWPYQYRVTVKNNAIGASASALATVTLPPGVAFLGNVTISQNTKGVNPTPALTLRADGALDLRWSLGALTTARYADPVVITFAAAIPYRFRSAANTAAASGPFAGPMSGTIIPEDTLLPASYEASAIYGGLSSTDGTQSTPADDPPASVTAAYATVSKAGSPTVVGIGSEVDWTLRWYVSEYYTATNVIVTDVLPDGMTYIDSSASRAPSLVQPNTPSTGKTTLTWELPTGSTSAGQQGSITLRARVDATYEAPPIAGQPVVSGDTLTNRAALGGDWQDIVTAQRAGALTPTKVAASVGTRMPTFTKQVWEPTSSSWVHAAKGFTGDTMRFRLTFAAAADIDAKGIVIRDFLPRGMTYVGGSASHSLSGTFADGTGCTSAPSSPTLGTLSGLQFLEWRLCNASRSSAWQATIEATIGDIPNVQPGWIVANFGKLAGQPTLGAFYSLRDIATTDYATPLLSLTKTANPSTGLVGGQSTTFTIAVKNNGTAAAYNLVVQDTLPANLLVPNSGGSASPAASSYTTTSGNPASGGGVVQWAAVASLAPGATQTFIYTATVPNGLPAGTSMTNLASVAYTSRADTAGHQWPWTSSTSDLNTKAATVFVRGLTVSKSATPAIATIGETVRWTITGSVPAGVIGYWPVVQENSLPDGFAYIAGSTIVQGATLDSAHHPQNPLGDGRRELRWFLQTIDNSAGNGTATFTIQFDTLITGFRVGQPATTYYPNNCCLTTAPNSVYVGWYDTSAGYNSQGAAYDGLLTNQTTRRSPAGTFSATIRQPYLVPSTAVDHALVGANDTVVLTLRAANMGNSIAYDLVLTDTLPSGLTLLHTDAMAISYPPGFPAVTTALTDTSTPGTPNLSYALDTLYVGATWIVTATASVDPAIAAGLSLTNRAATSYTSRPGGAPDTNGDGQRDERSYAGPLITLGLTTPAPTVQKSAAINGELTIGTPLVYTLLVPAAPINATIFSAAITDTLDSRLQLLSASGASASGNRVTTSFAPIPPGQQRTIVINTTVPANSAARDADIINNVASFSYAGHAPQPSNTVADTFVAPALVVAADASAATVAAGDTLGYTVTISNSGGGLATSLALNTTLPTSMTYIAGSARLNGQPLANPSGGTWLLPDLAGGAAQIVTFAAHVNAAASGAAYTATASATGADSRAQAIPADNHVRVSADSDPDDAAAARVYGPLAWQQSSVSVAFEDLKKVGWTDWDYNDFIVQMQISQGRTPDGGLAVLQVAYSSRARGAGFDHRFQHALPLLGGGRADVVVRTGAGQIVAQRHSVFGDEPSFVIFDRTKQVLPPFGTLHTTNTAPTQTSYVVGYTAQLTAVLDDPEANRAEDLPPVPWDPFITVYDTGQEVHLVIPGHLDNTQKVNTVFDPTTPLKGYDLPLAQVFASNWRWPIEYAGIWRAYGQYASYIGSGGTQSQQWAADATANASWVWGHAPATQSLENLAALADAPESRYFGGPALADLNGDGKKEIAIGNLLANRVELYDAKRQLLPGWPRPTGGGVKASPALADLDGDGKKEILAGAEDGKLYAWHMNGTPVAGWPIQVGRARLLATPAVADIDRDTKPDVVVPLADGKLYAFNANGTRKTGWPVSIGENADQNGSQLINSSPRIADLDGSGALKVIVGSTDHRLYVFNADGSLAWSYLTGDMILGAPAVADIVPSRPGQEIVVASGDSYVYLLGADGARIWRKRTGWTIRSTPLAADLNRDGVPEVLVGGDDHKLYAWRGDGTRVPGWPQTTGAPIFAGPAVGDLDGDGRVEVFAGSDDAHIYAWHADGTPVAGWPRATRLAVKGTPAVASLTSGAAPQVLIGDFAGNLYALDRWQRIYLPLVRR